MRSLLLFGFLSQFLLSFPAITVEARAKTPLKTPSRKVSTKSPAHPTTAIDHAEPPRTSVSTSPAPSMSTSTDRPPQFVLLAFDGSKELAMWQETRQFAQRLAGEGKTVKFTYFISGVYFLHEGNRRFYRAPYVGSGRSSIGWSASATDIVPRIDQINSAFGEGHEIGSHANGHFDGSGADPGDPMSGHPWSQLDWSDEFRQFNDMVFGAFRNNRVSPSGTYPQGWTLSERDIVGFRAPRLGVTEALNPTLQKFNFRYDTSKVSQANYWPQKNNYQIWNFPLAALTIAGTARHTLSMDYNFYYSQSQASGQAVEANPALKAVFQKQMFDTYMNYFQGNYYGARAPLHIGHHFSRWNKGAYWDAMKQFAQTVCAQPEVRCVTYKEYADWLDSLTAVRLATYKSSQFQKLQRTASNQGIAGPIAADVQLSASSSGFLATVGNQVAKSLRLTPRLTINGRNLSTPQLSQEQIIVQGLARRGDKIRVGAILLDRRGQEILSKTYDVENFGTDQERISGQPLEAKALQGDLPEAHFDSE